MATALTSQQSEQSLERELRLCKYLNDQLNLRGMVSADLAKKADVSKATISRMTNFAYKGKRHRPTLPVMLKVSLALVQTPEERRELFYLAFPEYFIWEEAAEKGYTVMQTNELLHERGLPLL